MTKKSDRNLMKLTMRIAIPHESVIYIYHDCFHYKISDMEISTKVELFDFFTEELDVNPLWIERYRYLDFLKSRYEVIAVVPEKYEIPDSYTLVYHSAIC